MYGKIFQSMYDGTISVNWKALVTFQQMIVLCDAEGLIDITPPALSKRTGIPLDIIEDGIEYLSQSDPYSRSQEHGGRRIILIDEHRPWGWIIVNHEYYRDLASVDDRREKARIRKQKQRAKSSEKDDVTLGHTSSRMSRHTNTDTNTDILKENNKRKVTIPKSFCLSDSMIEYAKKNGVTKRKTLEKFTENFILQNQAKGYKYVNHESAWKSWLRKAIDDRTIAKDPTTSEGDY